MKTLFRAFSAVLPWALMLAFLIVVAAPASFWLRVSAIRVADTEEGTPPALDVDREIRRDFAAEWIATVRRAVDHGGFIVACTATGKNDYRVKSELPGRLDLDWWTDPVKCNLTPGEYILTTRWIIDVPTPWDKVVSITSNVFTIRPKEALVIERERQTQVAPSAASPRQHIGMMGD